MIGLALQSLEKEWITYQLVIHTENKEAGFLTHIYVRLIPDKLQTYC